MKSRKLLLSSLIVLFLIPTLIFAQNPEDNWPDLSAHSVNAANMSCEGAGYPWISSDGLRLYFTGDAGRDHLFVSERSSPDVSFSVPQKLDLGLSKDVLSPWLNETETEIWFVVRDRMFETTTTLGHASRESRDEPWGEVEFVETDLENGFISSPSLSQDGSELFLFVASEYNSIFAFSETPENGYKNTQELSFAPMQIAGSGKLSQDGLRFYIGLKDPKGEFGLYYIERPTKLIQFDTKTLNKLEIDLPSDGQKVSQPSVWEAGNEIFFTRNPDGLWESNTLWSASFVPDEVKKIETDSLEIREEALEEDFFPDLEEVDMNIVDPFKVPAQAELFPENELAVEEIPQKADLQAELPLVNLVYPNPSKDIFNFELHLPADAGNAQLEIVTLEGQVVQRVAVEPSQKEVAVNLAGNASGTYLYRLTTDLGTTAGGRLVLIR